MAIELATNISQISRPTRVGSESFYHLVDSLDVNYRVETVISGNDPPPEPSVIGTRYLLFPNRTGFTPLVGVDYGIVEFTGTVGGDRQWGLTFDPTNPKTDFGFVYVTDEKKFYQFIDTTLGWIPILTKGSVDGGTFG
jgi:hypothetical protein